MINVVYLVIVMNLYDASTTSQLIPQADMQQCLANKKTLDERALKTTVKTSYEVYIRATCITGVK